jgi:hypothetical protein
MSSALKFHYSNPKFAGLPWPAAKAKETRRRCVKKTYSQSDAQRECASLRKAARGFRWFYQFCRTCNAFHVLREKRKSV